MNYIEKLEPKTLLANNLPEAPAFKAGVVHGRSESSNVIKI